MTSLAIDLLEDGENEEGSGEESEDSELNQGAILFTPDKEKNKGGRKTGALWSQLTPISGSSQCTCNLCHAVVEVVHSSLPMRGRYRTVLSHFSVCPGMKASGVSKEAAAPSTSTSKKRPFSMLDFGMRNLTEKEQADFDEAIVYFT